MEALDGAVKSCIPTSSVLKQELHLQLLQKEIQNIKEKDKSEANEKFQKSLKQAKLRYVLTLTLWLHRAVEIDLTYSRGLTGILVRVLDNDDDELRVAGYNQLCTVFKRIIADQTSDVKQAYLDAAAEMQLNPTERNRNHYNETKDRIQGVNLSVPFADPWRIFLIHFLQYLLRES